MSHRSKVILLVQSGPQVLKLQWTLTFLIYLVTHYSSTTKFITLWSNIACIFTCFSHDSKITVEMMFVICLPRWKIIPFANIVILHVSYIFHLVENHLFSKFLWLQSCLLFYVPESVWNSFFLDTAGST